VTFLEFVGRLLNYIATQHLAIGAIVISGLTVSNQIGVDRLQGESLSLSLGRNPYDDEDGSRYIWSDKSQVIETTWDVEIDNTSTQAPATISKWAIFQKWENKFNKVSGTEFVGQSSPFYNLSGESLPLPITIAAGNTILLRMKVTLGISQDAARDLYKLQTEHIPLKEAEQVYSFNLHDKGTPKDVFGDEAYDGGFFLSIPEDTLDHLKLPVLRFDLQSSRGKVYSAFASWYHFLYPFSRKQWDKGNREQVCVDFAAQSAPVTTEIDRWKTAADLSQSDYSICKSLETI
jgi:hypothetical protein